MQGLCPRDRGSRSYLGRIGAFGGGAGFLLHPVVSDNTQSNQKVIRWVASPMMRRTAVDTAREEGAWELPSELVQLRTTIRDFMREEVRPVEDRHPYDS